MNTTADLTIPIPPPLAETTDGKSFETSDTSDTSDTTTDETSEEFSDEGERKINLRRHTAAVDKLMIQNKELYKQLVENEHIIDDLEERLNDSTVKISRNLFYVCVILITWFIWAGNKHFTTLDNAIAENGVILTETRDELKKARHINEELIRKMDDSHPPKK